ncbi:hypothetical protein [Methylobacter tundripaludum]|uniref:hypothetical protein n=1 Tax=Methylobacter tundripaludum TaxID=173365 RepID=UPI00047F5919|nr:hypothetical protein [Methylobacter tundripaludum]
MNSPKFPRTNSLPGRALARLLKGQHLTHRSFQNATSSYRLAHFIFVLHGYNWAIQSIEKVGKTNDPTGRNATYAEYFFNSEDIRNFKNEYGGALDKFISAVDVFEQKGGGGEVV